MKKPIFLLLLGILVITIIFADFFNRSAPVFKKSHGTPLYVIMYHSVVSDEERVGKYVITPEKFEADLVFLKNNGFETVSLKQLVRHVLAGEPIPEKPILITFDDGMYNGKEYVLPLLEKHDACAVFAVVGSYADEYTASGITNPFYSYLKWDDINHLIKTGRVEFANHSYNLHSISEKRKGAGRNKNESTLDFISVFHEDTEKTQMAFYNNCLYSPCAYAYPFGNFSGDSERVLKKLGFVASFSCVEGVNIIYPNDPDCLFLLKRYNRDGRLLTENFFKEIIK